MEKRGGGGGERERERERERKEKKKKEERKEERKGEGGNPDILTSALGSYLIWRQTEGAALSMSELLDLAEPKT